MGLIDKLKEILFDEETVEIPVITKEEKKQPVKQGKKKDDEVRVKQISPVKEDEDLFDMPKLKEEAEAEVRTSTFTFPVFDDDDLDVKSSRVKKQEETHVVKEEKKPESTDRRRGDYLSAVSYKLKTDPSPSISAYTKPTVTEKPKSFSPSPIISPVYGILNENYKKEDIVSKNDSSSSRLSSERLDLDSVRKKAYGTLEDEIEVSLTKDPAKEILDEVPTKEEVKIDDKSDDGISINDLLVDSTAEADKIPANVELFDEEEDASPEIELDDEAPAVEEKKEKKEAIGEEDLFDLIDSLYAGKGEN